MRSAWQRLQLAPRRARWPIKWTILLVVTFFVLYPNPVLFVRHLQHLRRVHALSDPDQPVLAELGRRFDAHILEHGGDPANPKHQISSVQDFVNSAVPYGYDWEVWGVADYLPTLAEVLERGREDCDGRALVATALLRARQIDAKVVGDPRHLWVRAEVTQEVDGEQAVTTTETMGPLGEAAFIASARGLRIRWPRLLDLGPLAVGVSLFPFERELIILVTAWILLLPVALERKRAALGLFLLLTALGVIRLTGANSRDPSDVLVLWSLLHLPVAAVLQRCEPAKPDKHTVRSVS